MTPVQAVTLIGIGAAAASWGCVVERTDVPDVTGPSGFAYSILATADPSELPRDGRSRAVVTITVRDPGGLAAAGRRLVLSATPPAATVSASELVTDERGQASAIVTAPPAGSTGNEIALAVTAVDSRLSGPPPRVLWIPLLGPANRTRPTPEFVASPADPDAGEFVTFDASATRDEGTACDTACAFDWSFGDGGTATGAVVTHRFAAARSYPVALTVTDAASSTAVATQTITVRAVAAPSVMLTVSPSTATAGQQVSLAAVATVPRGHGVVRYEWDFGDGTRRTTTSPATLVSYRTPGRFTATVIVTDDLDQQGSAAATVLVADAFVFPEPVFTVSPPVPGAGMSVGFSGAGITVANGAAIVRYEWNFGDDSPPAALGSSAARHVFREPGTYTVTLTVTDSQSRVATRTRDVTIQ
jgi:PKD repeat protein